MPRGLINNVNNDFEVVDPTGNIVRRKEDISLSWQNATIIDEAINLLRGGMAVVQIERKTSKVCRETSGINLTMRIEIIKHRRVWIGSG